MKSIILLSGPVGAGKTTIARELIACCPGPTAYIVIRPPLARLIREGIDEEKFRLG